LIFETLGSIISSNPPKEKTIFTKEDFMRLNRIRSSFLVAGLLLALAIAAQPQETGIDYETQIQPIFTASCAVSGCHTGETRSFGVTGAGLVLLPESSYQALINAPTKGDPNRFQVVPGNSAESMLVLKLEGAEGVGSRMPLGEDPLPPETIQLVKDWIDQGALPKAPAPTAVEQLSWGGIKAKTRE